MMSEGKVSDTNDYHMKLAEKYAPEPTERISQLYMSDPTHLLNKNAVIREAAVIKDQLVRESHSDNPPHNSHFYRCMKDMFSLFIEDLRKTPILEIKDPWWRYAIEYDFWGIRLILIHERCEQFVEYIDDYKLEIPEIKAVRDFHVNIIVERTRLISIEEFAALTDTKPVTVTQWIKRCKLKSASKVGNSWMIPETADIPSSRGYVNAIYAWDNRLIDLPARYEFMNEYNTISFLQYTSDAVGIYYGTRYKEDKYIIGYSETLAREVALDLEYQICICRPDIYYVCPANPDLIIFDEEGKEIIQNNEEKH